MWSNINRTPCGVHECYPGLKSGPKRPPGEWEAQPTETGGFLTGALRPKVILSDQPEWTARRDHQWWGMVLQRTHRSIQKRKNPESTDSVCKRANQIRPFLPFTSRPSPLSISEGIKSLAQAGGGTVQMQNREVEEEPTIPPFFHCKALPGTGPSWGRERFNFKWNERKSFDYYIWLDILINEILQFCD